MAVSLDRARAAKAHALREFRKYCDVVGVGITRVGGEYAVKINLSERPAPGVELPTHVDGVPVKVEVTGVIKPRR